MVEERHPISVNEAVEKCMQHAITNTVESVSLHDANGRVLAEDLIATHDVPYFDRSPYDGFAIRAVDSSEASEQHPIAFRVVDEIGAGDRSEVKLAPFEAVRIMTGARLPEGADAVLMLERTEETEEGFKTSSQLKPGDNLSLTGEDLREGELILHKGETITPGVIAVLATFGYAQVSVYRKPIIGLIATGSELLDVDEPLDGQRIRNSNGPMIQAQANQINVECRVYQATEDHLSSLTHHVQQALKEVDCVVTTGGVSVGDFDLLPAVYEAIGAEVLFNKVAMRPGSVTTVAVKEGQFLFGLSGNPSACFTGFELFARPVLKKMMGDGKPYLPQSTATLDEPFKKYNPFTRFVRAIYQETVHGGRIAPAGFNKSNAISSIARSNAILVLPDGSEGWQTGDKVTVLHTDRMQGDATWTN
ncbi:molybdopterin molybdotransferase MoeA [Alkalibacillus salilacus]|uniref:Molybdopterin molybdenumtransferase n=1 Tax=Alkalibacillus salilacus TaxID=284582 RepID=A0ABT9VBT3_9BACI|nr:gephyrin-like molybdotransferase Glp [Alkalibacillus salilacus]MDQ0158280.1 molybdopterin molybdotransferase [Alkalibacillus salilacus]